MNKQMQRLATVMICAIPGLALAGTAPVNLLPNGDFSAANQLAGWQYFGPGAMTWNADDADASANSGSMELDTDSAGDPMDLTSSCFAVTPGAAYSYGLQGKVITGSFPAQGFICSAYSMPNCATSTGALTPYPSSSSAASWAAWNPASGNLPANAQSVDCSLHLDNVIAVSAASVRFDNVFFNSIAPTTPVSLQSFEVD